MNFTFGFATESELTEIIALLADDSLGAAREQFEDPLPDCYRQAFAAIDRDPNNHLVVCRNGGKVVGVLQLTYIPNLTYRGGWRAMVEGVRVHSSMRGEGLGQKLMEFAIEQARQKKCRMIQLTCDKSREASRRFYENLGFQATHEGMKLWFEGSRTGYS